MPDWPVLEGGQAVPAPDHPVLDGIEADKFHIYVGRDARTMNLMNRVAPRRSTHLIYRQMKDLLS